MLFALTTYLLLCLAGVIALSRMILTIGGMMAECPGPGPTARSAAVTIATGFGAIGTGGVLLIGAALPVFAHSPVIAVAAGSGFAALCLGLGFTQAITTLRAVLSPAPPAAAANERPA